VVQRGEPSPDAGDGEAGIGYEGLVAMRDVQPSMGGGGGRKDGTWHGLSALLGQGFYAGTNVG
jgi:hypothetical protein